MSSLKRSQDPKLDDELKLQIGERDGIRDKLRKMCRDNHLAALSAIVICLFIAMAILAPVIAPYGEAEQDLINRLQGPSAAHILGTDELGRDVFTRMLYGSRISIAIGILPSLISLIIGVIAGLTAGYFGGAVDYVIMRVADVMLSIPSLLLAMVVMYTLGSSTVNLFVALSMTGWSSVARVVRSQTLSIKQSEYIEAARSIGVGKWRIMIRHILPNCIPSLIVLFTLNVPSAILSESSLSFLGIGIKLPASSWGLIVNQGRQFLFTQPWLCMAPCVAIMIVVLAFNFLGDGLRDVMDPYMQR
ncbi:MAG TPA: ABC transporter permease [Candidatus Avilachnospira avicola]|nr:ABC transporter permease [Candidatus Avilachnospira avicola]